METIYNNQKNTYITGFSILDDIYSPTNNAMTNNIIAPKI